MTDKMLDTEGCSPRECDHHCARVCQQYVCPCDYQQGYAPIPERQRVCCQWELISPSSSKFSAATSHPIHDGDVLTRYFGVARSWREPHDPIRFTGVNHIPRWLHTDLSSLDFNYSNILKEREVMAACRQAHPPGFYQFRSIRPYNKTNDNWYDTTSEQRMPSADDKKTEKEMKIRKMSAQGLGGGQMPYLD